jgi:hypothetical protein
METCLNLSGREIKDRKIIRSKGVRLSPLGTSDTVRPSVPAQDDR